LNQFADSPSVQGQKLDTIGIVGKRLRMLFDVRAAMEGLDTGLYDVLRAADRSPTSHPGDEDTIASIQQRFDALKSMGNGSARNLQGDEALALQLTLMRNILGGALAVRKATDILDYELATEYSMQEWMIANRNRTIEITNNINFFQSATTGLVAGGLVYAAAN